MAKLDWRDVALHGDMTTGHADYPPRPMKGTSTLLTVQGTNVVLVGDPMQSPHCNSKGENCHTGVVIEGEPMWTVRGVPVAFHGSALDCGDTIAG